jgi:hypothetical protein
MEDPMNSEYNFQTGFCSDYETLLHECQNAKEASAEWRAEMNEAPGNVNRHVAGEMLRLQAGFAKAYARLEQHARDCELCKFVTRMKEQRLGYSDVSSSNIEEAWPA